MAVAQLLCFRVPPSNSCTLHMNFMVCKLRLRKASKKWINPMRVGRSTPKPSPRPHPPQSELPVTCMTGAIPLSSPSSGVCHLLFPPTSPNTGLFSLSNISGIWLLLLSLMLLLSISSSCHCFQRLWLPGPALPSRCMFLQQLDHNSLH